MNLVETRTCGNQPCLIHPSECVNIPLFASQRETERPPPVRVGTACCGTGGIAASLLSRGAAGLTFRDDSGSYGSQGSQFSSQNQFSGSHNQVNQVVNTGPQGFQDTGSYGQGSAQFAQSQQFASNGVSGHLATGFQGGNAGHVSGIQGARPVLVTGDNQLFH